MKLRAALKAARITLATAACGAVMATAVPAVVPYISVADAAPGTTVKARTALNVRSTPDTSRARIGLVYAGTTLQVRGNPSNGWTPITYQGRDAWVSSQYVTQVSGGGSTTPPPTSNTGNAGDATTTANLNVRRGPGLNQSIITVLRRGTSVTRTGQVSGSWTQIKHGSSTAWVSTQYLTTSSQPPTPPPAPPVTNPQPAPAPPTIGSRWGTVRLNLWTASTGSSHVEVAPTHTEFKITGRVENGRAEVVWKGVSRWVTARYLATKAPSPAGSSGECVATYYNTGAVTANGERYDPMGITTAHRNLPFNTKLKVTNKANGKSVVVRVNDRGPFIGDRCLDLSQGAFQQISPLSAGVINVTFEVVN